MNEKQENAIAWIRSGMNYDEGITLLREINPKSISADQFIGRSRSMAGKLAYEILKSVSLADHSNWKQLIQKINDDPMADWSDIPVKILPIKKPEPDKEIPMEVTDLSAESIEDKSILEYPKLIRKVIHEYAELFQERSKLHAAMAEMPESNAEAVCEKRRELFDLIKVMTNRMEVLYETKEAFKKTGELPLTMEELYPELQDQNPPVDEVIDSAQTDDHHATANESSQTEQLTEETLKKHKKNLQSGNSKDQTILDYQAKERKLVKNPMPKGPKRLKIEMRIQERNKQIEEIEMQLLLLPNAGAGTN